MASKAFLQQAYLAYFGRPADPSGLAFYAEKSEAEVKAAFSASPESQAFFGNLPIAAQINAIYQNLFNRDAEPAGLAYWAQEIGAGRLSLADAAMGILAGAQNDDKTAVANKLAASDAFTTALNTTAEILGYAGAAAIAPARAYLKAVDSTPASLTTATAGVDASVLSVVNAGSAVAGQPFILTVATDNLSGTAGNDTFTANAAVVINPSSGAQSLTDTLQSVDVINGGAGVDTLNIVSATGTVTLPTISNVEVITAESLAGLTLDVSKVSGLTNLNVTKAVGAVVATAAATTDVAVSLEENGTASALANTVDGGKNVTVTETKQGAASNPDTLVIGGTTAAAGNVVVNSTGSAYTSSTASGSLGTITITGGSSISVTQKAAADIAAAASDTTAATITQGAVTITGNSKTTTVTVVQDAAVTAANAVFKTGGVTETASAKFSALTAGQTIVMGGLTFTAPAAMTAAEAAATFASLVNNKAFAAPASVLAGDTQGGGAASKGTYTGVFSGWTSAAASGDTVVFTSTTANTDVTDLANSGTGTVTITTTAGKAHDAGAAEGKMGVANGAVSVTDASGTIKTLTVDGYATGSSTTTTSVLETLNLSNAATGATMTVADTAATLALNVEKMGSAATDAVLSITAAPTTLNVKSTGTNYVNLTAAATETLNVSGTGVFDADATDLAALKTIKVTETAGVKLNAGVADTVTSVDTTGTTGAVTVTIDGAKSTYAGGAGVDTVTLATTAALTKSIDLGAGDDTLSFGSVSVTGSTATLSGGDGTDTLAMNTAAADALDVGKQTFYTNFERLSLTNAFGTDNGTVDALTLDLANLGFTNYVKTAGTVFGTGGNAGTNDTLTLSNLATAGTVELTAKGLVTVTVKDASTGTADVLNLLANVAASDVDFGTLTAANVETVNLSASDTKADDDGNGTTTAAEAVPETSTLVLTADKATTVNVTGSANVALTLTGSTKVTSIDGSALTGNLSVTSLNTTSATTIKGGSGADVLVAATGTTADVLLGGDGNDVLVANAGLSTLTGGAGNDVFRVGTASLNVNSYATITDFAAGDLLQIAGATAFTATKVTLGDTAVFQDYANAAMNAMVNGGSGIAVGWFQFAGNTYVVADVGAESTTFVNNEDFIVKLTGLVDLSSASFNNTYDTIAL